MFLWKLRKIVVKKIYKVHSYCLQYIFKVILYIMRTDDKKTLLMKTFEYNKITCSTHKIIKSYYFVMPISYSINNANQAIQYVTNIFFFLIRY